MIRFGAPLGSGKLACVLASLLAAVAVAGWLLAGARPFGGAIGQVAFGLDEVSGFFLLLWLVELIGVAGRRDAGREVFAAVGGLLVLVAMDGIGLLAGLGLAALGRRRGALCVVAVLGGTALLGGGSFEAMREAGVSPEGLAALVGLTAAGAVLLGGPLGAYILVRVLLDLAGSVPGWAGGMALVLGGAIAAGGARWAWRTRMLEGVAAGMRAMLAGFAVMGAGLVMAGRAVDFAAPAALGFGTMWLSAAVAASSVPVLEMMGRGALGRMGGAMREAGIGGLGCLVACAGLALVPPLGGFAMVWQVLRALQALPVAPLVGGVAALGACVAVGFAAAAMLRVVRLGFAGGSMVDAPGPLARGVMAGLGGVSALVGLFPGAVIALAGGQSEIGYAPGVVGVGLAALCGITVVVARRIGGGGYRVIVGTEPVAPVWMPGLATGPAGRLVVRAHRRVARAQRRVRRMATWVDPLAVGGVAAAVLLVLAGLLLLRVAG